MIKIYNAGPLFNEAERKQRLYEGEQFRKHGFEVFNPLEEMNFGMGPITSAQIFEGDYNAMREADCFFFDLSTDDTGTMVELGIALQLARSGQGITIFPIISDSRVEHAGKFERLEVPKGWNKFMIGALGDLEIFSSFDDALTAAINHYKI